MNFQYELTVPAGTTKEVPVSQYCRLSAGTLTRVEVCFPPGPLAMVYVIVKDASFQLIPLGTDEALHWDNYIFVSEMKYELPTFPYELEVVGWAPDCAWQHVITFKFTVEPASGKVYTKEELETLVEKLNA